MYSLTTHGYIYYTDSGINYYLCGSRITSRPGTAPKVTAYYSSHKGIALTVWDWYASLCLVVDACKVPTLVETLIGAVANREGEAPWNLSIDGKEVRVTDPTLYSRYGILWVSAEGTRLDWNKVTPQALASVKPILKPQHLYDYAFRIGTQCSLSALPPDWKKLVHKITNGDSIGGAGLRDTLDKYFTRGKMFKPGVCFTDVMTASDMKDEMSSYTRRSK